LLLVKADELTVRHHRLQIQTPSLRKVARRQILLRETPAAVHLVEAGAFRERLIKPLRISEKRIFLPPKPGGNSHVPAGRLKSSVAQASSLYLGRWFTVRIPAKYTRTGRDKQAGCLCYFAAATDLGLD
jgi:hypothetical protein